MVIVSFCCVYSFLYAMLRSCSGKKGARKHSEEDENNKEEPEKQNEAEEEGVAEEAATRTAKRAPKKARAKSGNVLDDEACEELGAPSFARCWALLCLIAAMDSSLQWPEAPEER